MMCYVLRDAAQVTLEDYAGSIDTSVRNYAAVAECQTEEEFNESYEDAFTFSSTNSAKQTVMLQANTRAQLLCPFDRHRRCTLDPLTNCMGVLLRWCLLLGSLHCAGIDDSRWRVHCRHVRQSH